MFSSTLYAQSQSQSSHSSNSKQQQQTHNLNHSASDTSIASILSPSSSMQAASTTTADQHHLLQNHQSFSFNYQQSANHGHNHLSLNNLSSSSAAAAVASSSSANSSSSIQNQFADPYHSQNHSLKNQQQRGGTPALLYPSFSALSASSSNHASNAGNTWDSVLTSSSFSSGALRGGSTDFSYHLNSSQYLPSAAFNSNASHLLNLSFDYNPSSNNTSPTYMQQHQQPHYEQPPSNPFYNNNGGPNSSMDTNSSSLSFGYTPELSFNRHSASSSNPIVSLEKHFATTSFFGGMLDRPSTPPDSSVSFEAMDSSGPSERPEAMRTLYFGNLPPDLPISEFLNYVRGGVLEEVKYLQNKNCVFVTFLEAGVAASVYLAYQQSPFSIDGYECRVGWGKPSTLNPGIRAHVLKGATRNVFVGNLEPEVTPEELVRDFSIYGAVDCVKVIPEKRIGFVHMCSVGAAIKAVGHLCESENKWVNRRIYYGKDRCSTQAPPPPSASPALPEENRTVYIGGIHADVTTKDLCDVIRGGLLQQIKYFPEKNICFATFISADAASTFYDRSSADGLVLKSKRMKIGWGKPSMLPLSIANAVEKGASRNVYIGSIDVESSTKESIYAAFEEFGEIELVNIVAEKKIGFVSFTDIMSAIKAVEAMRGGENNAGHKGLFRRVNFGKDRCANNFRITKVTMSPPSSPLACI